METGPWPHLDRRQERGVVWGGTSPLPLRGACELRRTPLSGSSWNSPSTSFWVNKGNKRGDKAALTRPLRHHLLGLCLKETNLIPLHADYRVPPASADSLRSRLAASSEARMASSLSQKVMPRVLPLWRSPRAIMPLKPSISLPWGNTTSLAWRSPSSMSSGGPSKVLTLAYTACLLSNSHFSQRANHSTTCMMPPTTIRSELPRTLFLRRWVNKVYRLPLADIRQVTISEATS